MYYVRDYGVKREVRYNGQRLGTVVGRDIDYGTIHSVAAVEGTEDLYAANVVIGRLKKMVYLLNTHKPDDLVVWGRLQNPNPERYQDFGSSVKMTKNGLTLTYTDSTTLNNVESVYPLFK